MTTMTMAESLDAPMIDFSGEDIPMQTSSSTSWIHPEATMDDDSNFNLADVEIEMDNHQETFEYEMDDSSAEQTVEVHDVEVIDVSQAHTPALIDTVVEDATLASPAVPEHDLTDTHHHSSFESPPTLVIRVPSPTPQPAQDEGDHGIAGTETLESSEWDQGHSEPPTTLSPSHLAEQHQSPAEPANAGGAAATAWNVTAPTEQQVHSRQPSPTAVEQLQLEPSSEEPAQGLTDRWGEDENPVPSHTSSVDPHEVSDGIFIDPPPPVILSLGDSEGEHYLFNRPANKSPAADDGGPTEGSLFLHDFPTLYYEPLAKVFQTLRSDDHLCQLFDLSRGELVIDAYDLVDLVISEDNSYTNEVSFHDLNLLHDHADLAGPLRIRIGCNPWRFISRYRELKSKLEQFSLLDETHTDDAQLRERYDLAEQQGICDDPDHLNQDGGEPDGNPTSGGYDRATVEQQAEDPFLVTHTADRFDEGEYSKNAEPEQAQQTDDEEPTIGPPPGDERTGQPIAVVEDDREQGATTATDLDGDYPEPADELGTVHEHPDGDAPLVGENLDDYEEVVTAGEDYEADYNKNDREYEHGETVAIEGDTKDADWETTASEVEHTQDYLGQHQDPYGAGMTDKQPTTIDITTPNPDTDHVAGEQDTDTDSIGQRTLDEFADAQEGAQDASRQEGEESNSITDQSNEPNQDFEQFGDELNWDDDFGGDFDGEFGEFEVQSDVETGRVDSGEPASGKSSKRGFDEVDPETADEETSGDVSPNSKRKKVL